MSKRYEYKRVVFSNLPDLPKDVMEDIGITEEDTAPYDGDRAQQILETLGEEGWELVSRHEDDVEVKYIFKRLKR